MGHVDLAGIGYVLPDGRPLLTDVGFRVGEGATVALVGPNGAGKNVAVWTVAGVTFANGGDNIGVYVPVFLSVGPAAVVAYCIVFLVLVAALVMLAKFVATRPPIAEVLERWEHILFPIVLIGLGIAILVGGGAFGL